MLSLSSPCSMRPSPRRLLPSPSTVRSHHRTMVSAATGNTSTMYELLSIAETARPEEIKAAYKRQARRWHPDTCPACGDKGYFAQQFMRAREAYEVLSDPALREGYDLALRDGISPNEWAVAVSSGVAFRKNRDRSGFGDWEAQLESLKRRSAARSAKPGAGGDR